MAGNGTDFNKASYYSNIVIMEEIDLPDFNFDENGEVFLPETSEKENSGCGLEISADDEPSSDLIDVTGSDSFEKEQTFNEELGTDDLFDSTSLKSSSLSKDRKPAISEDEDQEKKGILEKILSNRSVKNERQMDSTQGCDFDPRLLYKCDQCQTPFNSSRGLAYHHSMVHIRTKPIKCLICFEEFFRQDKFDDHLKTHGTGRRFFGDERQTEHNLEPRFQTNSLYKCKQCQTAFKSKMSLAVHSRIHDRMKPSKSQSLFKCAHCKKSFSTKSGLSSHSMIHPKVKKFECIKCRKKFHRNEFYSHMKTHVQETRFQCDECPKVFYNKDSLLEHQTIHDETKSFKCYACPKTFQRRDEFSRHLARHLGETEYPCEFMDCQEVFLRKTDLARHLATHLKEKYENLYKCEFNECGREFVRKCDFTRHVETHEKEKCGHKCEFSKCGKVFTRKSDLTRHLAVHFAKKSDFQEHPKLYVKRSLVKFLQYEC